MLKELNRELFLINSLETKETSDCNSNLFNIFNIINDTLFNLQLIWQPIYRDVVNPLLF